MQIAGIILITLFYMVITFFAGARVNWNFDDHPILRFFFFPPLLLTRFLGRMLEFVASNIWNIRL